MRQNHTQIRKRASALLLGLLLAAEGAGSAFASPAFARSEEEWASLSDNRLEWEEIDALVNEYNVTVLQNRKAYEKDRGQNADEMREALLRAADDMEQLADEAEMNSGGSMTGASYRAQASSLRQSADSNVSDSDIIRWQYEKTEAMIAQSVRESFIAYYRAIDEKAAGERAAAYQEKLYQSAVNRKNAGAATEIEVLTAKEAWQNAEAALLTAEAEIGAQRRKMLTLCGWAYDADAEIGSLPAFDMGKIAETNLSADTEKALSLNLQLKIDERKLLNAPDSTLRDQYEKTVKNDREQIASSVKAAYDTLILAKSDYDTTAAQLALSGENLAASDRRLALGTISPMEHLKAENAVTELRDALKAKETAVLSAWVAYESAVNGLASTGGM